MVRKVTAFPNAYSFSLLSLFKMNQGTQFNLWGKLEMTMLTLNIMIPIILFRIFFYKFHKKYSTYTSTCPNRRTQKYNELKEPKRRRWIYDISINWNKQLHLWLQQWILGFNLIIFIPSQSYQLLFFLCHVFIWITITQAKKVVYVFKET